MRQRSRLELVLLACTAAAWIGSSGVARSQPAQTATGPAQNAANHHELPASVQLGHEETLRRLGSSHAAEGTGRGCGSQGGGGAQATHGARIGIHPAAADPAAGAGRGQGDARHGLGDGDDGRTKATREEIFEERARTTDALNGIIAAALPAHDNEAIAFAQDVAADVLVDTELEEPTVLLIGEYLHSKLDAAH